MRRDVALILLYNENRDILMQMRDEEAERLPGYLAFFGGGLNLVRVQMRQ